MKNTPENVRLLRDVLRKEAPALLRKPGVRDVRVGLKEEDGMLTRLLCIQALVKQKQPPGQLSPKDMIRVAGYPTDVIEIGPRESLGDHDDCPTIGTAWARDGRAPFVQGGVNIQREGASEQGTLGMFVYDALDPFPVPHILTCAHVIGDRATRSDYEDVHVTQGSPGAEDRIAEVTRSVYRKPAGRGVARIEVDAALARVVDGDRELRAGIMELDDFEPIILEPSLGMAVVKQGARTGITEGQISAIDGNLVHFQRKSASGVGDEILVCSGDSGSILLGRTAQGTLRPVGLVIAQVTYDLGGFYRHWGIATRFSTVASELRLRLEPRPGRVHRYRNQRRGRHTYVAFDSPIPQDQQGDYEYVEPAFDALSPDDLDTGVAPLSGFRVPPASYFFSTGGADGAGARPAFIGTIGALSREGSGARRPLRRCYSAARDDYLLCFDDAIPPGYDPRATRTGRAVGATRAPTQGPSFSAFAASVGDAMTIDEKIAKYIAEQKLESLPPIKIDKLLDKRPKFLPSTIEAFAKEYKNAKTSDGQPVFKPNGRFTEAGMTRFDRCHDVPYVHSHRLIVRALKDSRNLGEQFYYLHAYGRASENIPDNASDKEIRGVGKDIVLHLFNKLANLSLGPKSANRAEGRAIAHSPYIMSSLSSKDPQTIRRLKDVRAIEKSSSRLRTRIGALSGGPGIVEVALQGFQIWGAISTSSQIQEDVALRNSWTTFALLSWWFGRDPLVLPSIDTTDEENPRINGISEVAGATAYKALGSVGTPAEFYKATLLIGDGRSQALDFVGESLHALVWVDAGTFGFSEYKLVPLKLKPEDAVKFKSLYNKLDRWENRNDVKKRRAKVKTYKAKEVQLFSMHGTLIELNIPGETELAFFVIAQDRKVRDFTADWVEPLNMVTWVRTHTFPWPLLRQRQTPPHELVFVESLSGGYILAPNFEGYAYLRTRA